MKKQTSEIRREQIKKAVLEIITKEGLHNLSIRNLAKIVGITEGAIFRHFKSKREIILSILNDVRNELMSELRDIAQSTYSAREKLLRYLSCHIEYIAKNKGISILLFSDAAHLNYKVLRTRLRSILSEQEALIVGIVQDGIKAGVWNKKVNVNDFAVLYMSIPIALNVEMIFNGTDLNIKDFSKRMFDLIITILKK